MLQALFNEEIVTIDNCGDYLFQQEEYSFIQSKFEGFEESEKKRFVRLLKDYKNSVL